MPKNNNSSNKAHRKLLAKRDKMQHNKANLKENNKKSNCFLFFKIFT